MVNKYHVCKKIWSGHLQVILHYSCYTYFSRMQSCITLLFRTRYNCFLQLRIKSKLFFLEAAFNVVVLLSTSPASSSIISQPVYLRILQNQITYHA